MIHASSTPPSNRPDPHGGSDAGIGPVTSPQFRAAMRRLASGVSIVTTTLDGNWLGFSATSVSSVSAEPPTLLVCVNKTVSSHDAFMKAGRFCVNVIGERDIDIARRFGDPASRDVRFSLGEWSALATGSPALLTALACFDCELTCSVPVHTHTIAIGRIVRVRTGRDNPDPLVYVDGDYRQVGRGA